MDESYMKGFYSKIKGYLSERDRRLVVAAAAMTEGRGGISKMNRATGMSREVIGNGIAELELGVATENQQGEQLQRVRKVGGGRKSAVESNSSLLDDLNRLIEPATRGDPESALLWTSKSLRKLSEELALKGHKVSYVTVGKTLRALGFSLQADFKTVEPGQHADRNEQFEYIYSNIKDMQERCQPVISVDAKKRENVGNFKNNGREWQPGKNPVKVNTHDFEDKELGHAIPFGVYDITGNQGWVSVGITRDTSQFAVSAIRSWWNEMGSERYPDAVELMITADSGGSNGYRRRLWKTELQKLADETGMVLHILHFPPNTSKWNKIEHRMFSYISKNWRGRPLVSLEVIVNLIANTTTTKGLKIKCAIDSTIYETGIKVTDEEMADVILIPDDYHGEWNYKILPRKFANVIT